MKYIFLFCLLLSPLFAQEKEIAIENRILAKINGKAITVMDVTKKMDLYLLRTNPDAFHLPEMRYQFYSTTWKDMFHDMFDRELVLKAAEEQGMPMSAGDVRQEIEELFGPNVLTNLERAGLSYEEAFQMVRSEIMIRRMLQFQVNARVQASITPEDLRAAYDFYAKEGHQRQEVTFRIVTFRAKDLIQADLLAKTAYKLIQEEKMAIEAVEKRLSKNAGEVTISLSDPFSQNEKQVARPIMAILSSLTSGQVSEPVLQRTREGTPVMRIYILDEKKISTIAALPFEEMVDALKQQIAAKRQKKEMDDYFARLRRHFGVREEEIAKDVPSNFEPYVIQ